MSVARVAISATFTAEPLREPLELFLRLLRWPSVVEFAPFAQVFQTLLDPNGLFARNAAGFNIVLLRAEDLSASDAVDRLAEAASRHASLLIRVCPPNGLAMEQELLQRLPASVLSSAGQDRLYPVHELYDPRAHHLGAIPYTSEYFAALAAQLARELHRLNRVPAKVITLDCDDTLWSGVCGEDGPYGVSLDSPRRELQVLLKAQRDIGRLLTIASKNNEGDVLDTFRAHPEMPLAIDDFAARRINWEPKAVSLRALAQELNLGLDSFVFVDDNPKESQEVAAELPEVAAVTLPAGAEDIPDFIDHVWAFDAPPTITAEDRRRASLYAQQAERTTWQRQARTLEEFIAGLELSVDLAPIQPADFPRVAQLTQRTNQMNFSTRRRTEADVAEFLATGGIGRAIKVRDRFGDYGLTGLLLLQPAPPTLFIDTFLLSCRALGRGVEHRMLREAGAIAQQLGLATVTAPLIPTPRNAPAQEFLASIAPAGELIPAETLAALVYEPSKSFPHTQEPAPPPTPHHPQAPDYQRIALLRRPADILAAIQSDKLSRATPRTAGEPPRTDLERRLCVLWSELLGLPSIGIHDNFFDLGGHSLLAVQLVAHLQKELALDLPLEAVYTGTLTVAELARSIEIFQLTQLDAVEYAALLAEIESLTDEEAEALLATEQAAYTRS
jgi:FkbH-like protein